MKYFLLMLIITNCTCLGPMLVLTTVWTKEKSSCVFSKVNTHGFCQKANSGIYSVQTKFHIFCPNVNYQKFQRNILDATTNQILGRRKKKSCIFPKVNTHGFCVFFPKVNTHEFCEKAITHEFIAWSLKFHEMFSPDVTIWSIC